MLLPLFLVWILNPVGCQADVESFTGGTVLLPCVLKEQLPENVSISWRDQDDNNVLEIDIVKNVPTHSTISNKFRDRVLSSPEKYSAGNFSIRLVNVQQSDSGPYDCHIHELNYEQRTVLSVSGLYD